LRDRASDFRAAGARVVLIGLAGIEMAKAFRDEERIPFPLLLDAKRTAYRAATLKGGKLLDLVKPSTFRAAKIAKQQGHRQHEMGKNPLQLGGSFVFAPGDKDLFLHPSRTFADNATPDDLLAAVRGWRP
jgi:hypothetical protein